MSRLLFDPTRAAGSSIRVFIVLPFLFALSQHPSNGAEGSGPTEGAKRTIDAIIAARAELRGGIFYAVGQEVVHDADGAKIASYASEAKCVFDTTGGRLRFERRGQRMIDLRSSEELTPAVVEQLKTNTFVAQPRLLNVTAMLVRSGEYSTFWHATGNEGESHSARGTIVLRDPDAQWGTYDLDAFDPSAAGLFEPAEYSASDTVADILNKCIARASIVDVETQADGKLRLVFSNARMRREIDVDPNRGFTATRMLYVELDSAGQPKELPNLTASADWEAVDGVWVPVRISTGISLRSGEGSTHLYDLNWEAVNPDRIDDATFTYKDFKGVWAGTAVIDERGDKPRHVDTIGKPFVELPVGLEAVSRMDTGVVDRPGGASTVWWWLLLVNGILLAAVSVFLYWKRSARSS